MATILLHILLF